MFLKMAGDLPSIEKSFFQESDCGAFGIYYADAKQYKISFAETEFIFIYLKVPNRDLRYFL